VGKEQKNLKKKRRTPAEKAELPRREPITRGEARSEKIQKAFFGVLCKSHTKKVQCGGGGNLFCVWEAIPGRDSGGEDPGGDEKEPIVRLRVGEIMKKERQPIFQKPTEKGGGNIARKRKKKAGASLNRERLRAEGNSSWDDLIFVGGKEPWQPTEKKQPARQI